MKAKLKSTNKIGGLLLAHGEKLGMAAVLVVAGLLIKASLGRERLAADKHPPQLQAKAAEAQQHYQEMSWDNFPQEERVDHAVVKSVPGGGVMKPVNEGDFPILANAFDPPVTKPVGLRTDPSLLAPTKLEVNSGSGLWAYGDPEVIRKMALAAAAKAQREAKKEEERRREEQEDMDRGRDGRRRDRGEEDYRGRGDFAGGMSGIEMTEDGVAVIRPNMGATPAGLAVRNQSWVTVLAKVPIKQQVETYKDALSVASGYNEQYDQPKYIGYVVERAEVTEDGQQKWVTLQNVLKATIIKAMESRPFEAPEIADPKYTHPLLTWPLPPMVLRPWGEDVTHSDMPPPSPEDMYMDAMAAEDAAAAAQPEVEASGDDFADQISAEARARMPAPGELGRGEGYMREPMGGYGGTDAGGRMSEMGGYGGGYGGEMAMGRGAGGYTDLPDKPWDGRTKYILFRYFDGTVEPGHRYRYRVRLAVADVNSDSPERRIAEKYLDPTVVTRKAEGPKDKAGKPVAYRFSDWSDPSPTAAVPMPGLIYLVKVTPANAANASSEPVAQVLVKSLDAKQVAEVGLADTFWRGSVMNKVNQKAQIIWSGSYNLDEDGQEQSPEFDFVTGLTLLDFTGGEKLGGSRDQLAPSRALVMDSTGRMMVEEELEDTLPVREYNLITESVKKSVRDRQENDRGGRGDRGRDRGRSGRSRR